MKLGHWNMVIAMRLDISRLLERTLAVESTRFGERMAALPVDPATLTRLNGELRTKLDTLRDNLNRELTENETYLVMFPLVLLCDEMVMCRLAKEQQTSWSLLQSELFQINYGGDVFYDFVDERLDKPDTPPMVFEVLYFCLAAGFVGKFGESSGKVQRYRTLLAEQLSAQAEPLPERRRRRALRKGSGERLRRVRRSAAEEPEASAEKTSAQTPRVPQQPQQLEDPPRRRVDWRGLSPYGLALASLLLAIGAIFLFTNI
jgi:type VI secretion system protein ImpK